MYSLQHKWKDLSEIISKTKLKDNYKLWKIFKGDARQKLKYFIILRFRIFKTL